MSDLDDLMDELRQKRDEIRVQINLASKDLRDEWEELEGRMEDFSAKAKKVAGDAHLKETGEGIGNAMVQLGHELKLGYERIRDAIKDS